jgi:predicted RND superfamily exporter protein
MDEKGIDRHAYVITGTQVLTGELKGLIIHNMWSALWIAGVSIAGILLAYYRSMKLVLLSTLPLLSGLALLSGLLVLFGQDFNFFNLIVIPMIVGIGIDDGVHIVHRYKVEGFLKTPLVLASTGKAVLLTSLTTIAGFGSMMITTYRGFISLGALLSFGVAACLLTTLLFLPSIICIWHRGKPA